MATATRKAIIEVSTISLGICPGYLKVSGGTFFCVYVFLPILQSWCEMLQKGQHFLLGSVPSHSAAVPARRHTNRFNILAENMHLSGFMPLPRRCLLGGGILRENCAKIRTKPGDSPAAFGVKLIQFRAFDFLNDSAGDEVGQNIRNGPGVLVCDLRYVGYAGRWEPKQSFKNHDSGGIYGKAVTAIG